MDCRLFRVGTTFDMSGDILKHHYGIVDDATDGNGETRHGNHVQGTASSIQIYERRNQRHRDGDTDDEHRSPSAEEDEYDKHDEEECVHHSLEQRVDRHLDIVGSIDNNSQLNIGRKVLLKLREHFLHLVGNLYGIGATLLLNDNHSTLLTIGEGTLRTFLNVIDNAGYILQIDVGTVTSADNDILHLGRVIELTLDTYRICLGTCIHCTTSDVLVLGSDCSTDLCRRDAVCLHEFGIHIDVDLSFRSTRNRHRTNSVDTSEWVSHLFVKNLVECALTLLCSSLEEHDRNHVSRELEQDRCIGIGRQCI